MAVSRETVDALSLEEFKIMLDVALSNLIQWKMSVAGRLDWNDLLDPCWCKPFNVSIASFVYENRSKDTMERIQIILILFFLNPKPFFTHLKESISGKK